MRITRPVHRPGRRSAARRGGAIIATALMAAVCLGVPSAGASTPEPPRPAFYEAPATLPSANGAVIRTESLDYFLDPANISGLAVSSRKVLYRSTNRTGKAIAVSGGVITPKVPWTGPGARPVVAVGVGTQGMADKCAPTRAFAEKFEYELISMVPLLARGYSVAFTDYEGLGTAGLHTYMDRVSQGQALLDVARAARNLGGNGVTATSPVGVQGYSQGGGAAAAAAELAANYAPDLNVKGALVGAVPANLHGVAKQVDGGLYSSFLYFATSGLAASYGIDMTPYVNAKGKAFLADIEQDCVTDLFSGAFVKSTNFTATGEPLSNLMARAPWAGIIDDQILGRTKPSMPVLVTHSVADDVIPFQVGRTMAKQWCGKGAKVRFVANAWPAHVGGMTAHVQESLGFWDARFNNRLFLGNCGWF